MKYLSPPDEALQALLHKIITRLMKLLTRRGVLVEEEEGSRYLADAEADSYEARSLRPLQAAACTYRIAFGPRAGQKVFTVQGAMAQDAVLTQALCADHQGFSLHAAVRCKAHERQRLEQLCRTITRTALANERVQINAAGQVVLKLKTAWRDGTAHIVMSPLEFMQRLAALANEGRLSGTRATTAAAPDPLPRGAGAQCQAEGSGTRRAGPGGRRVQGPPPRSQAAHTPGQRASVGPGCSSACLRSTWRTARTAVVSSRSSPPSWRHQGQERILTHLGLQARAPAHGGFEQAA